MNFTPYEDGPVTGFLHRPEDPDGRGLVLTHGAGANCRAPLLIATANAFSAAGVTVLRCDLPFRQRRPNGPPHPGTAAADREGLREALTSLKQHVAGPLLLGGHSYGGRQGSMLAADNPGIARALLLLSYPLHPPAKPEQLRTAHFAKQTVPSLFVQGDNDAFGTLDEMSAAIATIPAATKLLPVVGAAHDLKRGRIDFAPIIEALNALADTSR